MLPVGTDGGRQRTQLSHTGKGYLGAVLQDEELRIVYYMRNAFDLQQ